MNHISYILDYRLKSLYEIYCYANRMSDAKHLNHSKGDVLKNQDQENLITSNPKKSIHELLNLWKHYTNSLPNNDLTVRNIATELCTLLVKTKSFEALQVFLEALPDCHGYELNENFVRAKIHSALYRKDTRAVYKLIEVRSRDSAFTFAL